MPYGDGKSLFARYPLQVENVVGWQDFWRFEADGSPTINFTGPAAPFGTLGALRAARVLTLPECSKSIPFTTIYKALTDKLDTQLTCLNGPLGVTLRPSLTQATATPYLYHVNPTTDPRDATAIQTQVLNSPDPQYGVVGGLLVGGNFNVSANVASPCDITFKYDLRFTLDNDGLFALDPRRIQLDVNGIVGSPLCNGFGPFVGAKTLIQQLFEQTLPHLIRRISEEEQALLPAWEKSFNPSGKTNDFTCPYPSVSHEQDQAACKGAAVALKALVSQGATALGRQQTDVSALWDVIDNHPEFWYCRPPTDEEFGNNESAFDSCSVDSDCPGASCIGGHCADQAFCAQPPAVPPPSGIKGRCEFLLPARGLIVEPDEIRIGFAPIISGNAPTPPSTQSPVEATPSNVAFFVAAALNQIPQLCTAAHPSCVPKINGACPAGFKASSLCSDSNANCVESITTTHPFYHRYFATLDLSGRTCKDPPTPILCACSSTGMCANGDFCGQDTTTHANECARACNENSDCTQRIVYDSPVNTCTKDAECTNGLCVNGICQINTANTVLGGAGCWKDLHLCASGAQCTSCYPWEHCNTSNIPGLFGPCVENVY